MKILDYVYPNRVWKSLKGDISELKYYNKYKGILRELEESNKLKEMGISHNAGKLYLGIDLNPELLLYSEESQNQVELNFISEKMRRFTDFFQKEGILDVIKADYDRVQTTDYYGYVVQIEFDFKRYKKSKFKYAIGYFSSILMVSLVSLYLILR
jgi:hypothetical protein